MNFFSERFERVTTEHPNAYVLHSTTFTTVAAVQEYLDATTAEISSPDASTILSGHQVSLNFSNSNPISITVTAENGVTKQYTVNVRRRYNDGRLPFRDFNFLTINNSDTDSTGLWSDGANMWVLDSTDMKIHVYKMAENEWGKIDGDKWFGLETSTSTPSDIWSNDEIMWVTDAGRDKIYVYDLNAAANHYHSSEDFNTLIRSSNKDPRGLWADEMTMWVVDDTFRAGVNFVKKLFAYVLNLGDTNKHRVANKEFTLSVDNSSPGVFSRTGPTCGF